MIREWLIFSILADSSAALHVRTIINVIPSISLVKLDILSTRVILMSMHDLPMLEECLTEIVSIF